MSTSAATELLPPLVFEPRFVEKIWGGRRLQSVLNKSLPGANTPAKNASFGESWELFDFPPGVIDGETGWVSARVAHGDLAGTTLHDLVTTNPAALLGDKVPLASPAGPQFPLLIKFLDAREDLSIQVHPTPAYAATHAGAALKTECWIVLDHTPGAFLYKSIKPGVSKAAFEQALKAGNVAELIATVPARVGDCHFLPSGVVHALGAGTLVAEVQTPSDTTYRVFDFNRVEGTTGKPRKLHIEQALECINFTDTSTPPVTSSRNVKDPLVSCEYFKTMSVKAAAHTVRPLPKGTMKIWMVTEGAARLKWAGKSLEVAKGQTVLIPAGVVPGLLATFPTNTAYLETVLP